MSSSINVLDQSIFDKPEEESSAEVKKDEAKNRGYYPAAMVFGIRQ